VATCIKGAGIWVHSFEDVFGVEIRSLPRF
jgi:hypothetical protein